MYYCYNYKRYVVLKIQKGIFNGFISSKQALAEFQLINTKDFIFSLLIISNQHSREEKLKHEYKICWGIFFFICGSLEWLEFFPI